MGFMARAPIDEEKRKEWLDPCRIDRGGDVWYGVGEVEFNVSYENARDANYIVTAVRHIDRGYHVREECKMDQMVAVLQHIVYQRTSEMVGSMAKPYPIEFYLIRGDLVDAFRAQCPYRNPTRVSLAFAKVFGSDAWYEVDRYIFPYGDDRTFRLDDSSDAAAPGPAGEEGDSRVASGPESPVAVLSRAISVLR